MSADGEGIRTPRSRTSGGDLCAEIVRENRGGDSNARMVINMIQLLHVPLRTQRRAAVAADLDPRTVAKVVCGFRVRPSLRERAVAALAAEGVDVAQLPSPAPRSAIPCEGRVMTDFTSIGYVNISDLPSPCRSV